MSSKNKRRRKRLQQKAITVNPPDPQKQPDLTEAILKITAHAQDQISWVRSAYAWIGGIIGFFTAVLFGVGIWYTYSDVQEFKDEIRENGKQLQVAQQTGAQLLADQLRIKLEGEVDLVRKQVTARIDKEFKDKRIAELVHNEAKVRIDLMADLLIKQAISNQLSPIRIEFSNQLATNQTLIDEQYKKLNDGVTVIGGHISQVKNVMTRANGAIDKINDQSEMMLNIIRAQLGERGAYDELLITAEDKTNGLSDLARVARVSITAIWAKESTQPAFQHVEIGEKFYTTKLSDDEINKTWNGLGFDYARDYVGIIWGHTNISKLQKMKFFRHVLDDSKNNLSAVNYVGKMMSQELHLKYNPPFDFRAIIAAWPEWLRTNRLSISVSTNASIPPSNQLPAQPAR